jgi:hypothetical protein
MQPFRKNDDNTLQPWVSGRVQPTNGLGWGGGVCVRPRQGKRVGRWYDVASETGAVRLQIDCITTSLIEVDGGVSARLISSLCSGKGFWPKQSAYARMESRLRVTCQYRSDRLEANMSGTGDLVILSCFPPQTRKQRMKHHFVYQQHHRHPQASTGPGESRVAGWLTAAPYPDNPPCCRLRHNTITTDRPKTQSTASQGAQLLAPARHYMYFVE